MIEPKELRVGNFVNVPHGDVQIAHFIERGAHFTDDCGGNWQSLKPIPLTPEWLERMGFRVSYANEIGHTMTMDTDCRIDLDWVNNSIQVKSHYEQSHAYRAG